MPDYTIIRISDGTTTVALATNTETTTQLYGADGWAPAVAPRTRARFANRDLYEDVDEQLKAYIVAATPAAVTAEVNTLARLLEQAQAFTDGEAVAPVYIEAQPHGSTLATPMRALLTTPPGYPLLDLPRGYFDTISRRYAPEITIRLRRRGRWVGPEEMQTGAGQAGHVETTVTFASAPSIPAPLRLSIAGFTNSGSGPPAETIGPALLAVGTAARGPAIWQAWAGAANINAGDFSVLGNVTDTTNNPRWPRVLRFRPSVNTNPTDWQATGTTAITITGTTMLLFATVRNNSATVPFEMHARVNHLDTSWFADGPITRIPAGITVPRVVTLGTITVPTITSGQLRVGLVLRATAIGDPTLDIDSVGAVFLDDLQHRALTINPVVFSNISGTAASALQVDPLVLSGIAPAVTFTHSTTGSALLGYRGDAWLLAQQAAVRVLYLATNDSNWTVAGRTLTLTAHRRPAALVPA